MMHLPLKITPSARDIEMLARARLQFATRRERQAHRERAIVAGTATDDMIDAALADKSLSRVLAGPRSLMASRLRSRG
jgi:hypothetical protein